MAVVFDLCKKLIKEVQRLNSFRNSNKMSKEDFKKLVNGYIDELWK